VIFEPEKITYFSTYSPPTLIHLCHRFTSASLWISIALSPLALKNARTTLLFDSTLLKHSRHFDYWNQPRNISMLVCYRNCHETGLCCYLMIYIWNLLRPLQLFYFQLWPIYWLSLIWIRLTDRKLNLSEEDYAGSYWTNCYLQYEAVEKLWYLPVRESEHQ
jgi:hypothetical protein